MKTFLSRRFELLKHICEASVNIRGCLPMELLITLGRDCVVSYQNEASAKIDALPVGVSLIKRTFVMSWEEVRDLIFGGKTISFSNRSLSRNDREISAELGLSPAARPGW